MVKIMNQIKKEEKTHMPKQFNFWIVASGDAARKICNYLSKQIIYMRNNQYKKTFYTLQREMLLTGEV